MLPSTMAVKPFLCLGLLWTTLSTVAQAAEPQIPTSIVETVPTCARPCFQSWISANLDLNCGGKTPSLRCMCKQTGAGGYTLGEGAVACMIGEKELGNCRDTTAGVQATTKAYNICESVEDSASRTHDVIVATLILPTGTGNLAAPTLTKGTGSAALSTVTKSAAPAPTTHSTSPSTTTTSSSRLTSTTSTEFSETQTSTLSTRPSSIPSVEPAASNTTAPAASNSSGISAPAGMPAEKEQPALTSAQIAGITIGCVAVVALGFGLVLLARCARRKRMGPGDPEKGFNRMRDSFKSFGRRSITGPDLLGISYPIQRIPSEQGTPTFRPTKAPRADGVGLAILPGSVSASNSPRLIVTRATAGAAPILPMPALPPAMIITPASRTQTPVGKKETPKPNLTLAIPKNPPMPTAAPAVVPRAVPTPAPVSSAAPLTGRDSVITEFAEDGEGESRSGTAIWRPPPSDPQSATTYYFADKKGNWVLRNSTVGAGTKPQLPPYPTSSVELPSPQDKTKAERAYMPYTPGMVVAPLRVPSRERERGAFVESPVAMRDDAHPRDNVASSVYSEYNAPLTVAPGPENPMPAVPSAVSSENNNTGRNLTGTKTKRKSVKRTSRQRRMSQDSATEIESGAEEDDSQDLSPVAESPYSPSPLSSGKSPVSYPKIHKQGKNVNEGLQQLRDAQQALGNNTGASTGPEPPRRNSKRMSKQQGQGQGRFPIRIVTPEERENEEGMRMGAVPHGTPQMTIGMSRPMHAPVVNPNRNKNPGQMRTGSPEGRFPIAVPVEHQQQRQQPQRRQSSVATGGPNGYWNQQQQQPQQAHQGQGEGSAYYYRAPSPRQWEQQQRQLQQAQRVQQQQQQPSYFRPSQGHYEAQQQQRQKQQQQQRQYRPQQPPMPQQSWPIFAQPAQPQHHQQQHQQQGPQHQHTRTNSSSLLTKRLGAEKAAALALNPNSNNSSNKSIGRPAKGWARDGQGQQQQQQPPQQYWQEGQAQNWGNTNNARAALPSQQNPYSGQTNERFVDLPPPPITPGWVPELTPTRRGDDLFLNVQ